MDKPTVFISYSHKDEVWKDRLKPQLVSLENADRLTVWDDRDIDAGETWYPAIEKAMQTAGVAVCMISEHFLASTFCTKEEVPYLLERREKEGMAIIPVLISPCPWEAHTWLSRIQMLPGDGKSVLGNFKDDWAIPFSEVAKAILKIIDNSDYQPPPPSPPAWSPPEKMDIVRLPMTGAELFGRKKELELLDSAWKSDETHVISLVAWGGVGKSTLVNKWLEKMGEDN
ncbi:MAG: toll/interleukin-1 receptor domain-containing protein, partial [Desulfobacterales bacterium]|nr:toll/interleukin-1 receptor domain-containing protein [Desulfobacterales bacterium]